MADVLGLPYMDEFNELNIQNLTLNSAYMVINTSLHNIGVYVLRDNCLSCPYKLEVSPTPNVETSWQFDTSSRSTWRILNTNKHKELPTNERNGLLCEMRPDLGEFGVYNVLIGRCEAKQELAPVNSYAPLLLLLAVFLGAYFVYGLIKFMKRRNQREHDITEKNEPETIKKSDSLQVLRGIIITLLIFTTCGGGGYPLFNVQWGGMTMAEVIFLMYMWTIGVYIPIFVIDARSSERSKWYLVKEILLRGLVLLVLGTLINSTIQAHNSISLWSPLQRLGIAYFIVGTAYVLTVQKFVVKSKKIISKMAENLVSLLWCWILSGFLLAIILILISTFASFNCVANVSLSDMTFDHSGISSNSSQTCNNGLTESANVIFVDVRKKLINVNHFMGFSRGLLGIMSTIIPTMIGLKTGNIYVRYTTHGTRIKLWNGWAFLFLISGGVFAWASYPLKFNLQPISTMLVIPTIGMYLLILIYTTTEIMKFPKIFKSTGLSSLIILTGHLLFSNSVPFIWNIPLNSHILYLVQNMWTLLLWTMISLMLIKKNIMINM